MKLGLFDLANENVSPLNISLGLMKSLYHNFCCCLCWGLLQLPQQKVGGGNWMMSNSDYLFSFLMHKLGRQQHWKVYTLGLNTTSLIHDLLKSLVAIFFQGSISYHYLTGFWKDKIDDNACKYLVSHAAHIHCLPNASLSHSKIRLKILVGTKRPLHSKSQQGEKCTEQPLVTYESSNSITILGMRVSLPTLLGPKLAPPNPHQFLLLYFQD